MPCWKMTPALAIATLRGYVSPGFSGGLAQSGALRGCAGFKLDLVPVGCTNDRVTRSARAQSSVPTAFGGEWKSTERAGR
jgi:hypothetical protein